MDNEEYNRIRDIIEINNLFINQCDDGFWIIDGWKDLETLVQKYNNLDIPRKYGDLRISSEGIELGLRTINIEKGNWLSDKISPPYLKPEGLKDIDDILGDWGFSDEYSSCSHCSNHIRTSPDSYNWTADYWINDGELICGDDIRDDESITQDYINHLINKPNAANTVLTDTILENNGFNQCKCKDEICDFEASMFGHIDEPKEILKSALAKNPDKEYLFDISSTGQFGLNYTIWNREKTKDD